LRKTLSVEQDRHTTRLEVKVTPNAGRNQIVGFKEGVLQVRVAAPPEKGKANKELIDFLAEELGIKKSAVLIIKGQTSRYKTILISGMSDGKLRKRISI
jgi:uncharacterized protein (TIGR00251 family)